MPPLSNTNFLLKLYKNTTNFFKPIDLITYLLSLLVLPPLFELYHRIFGYFKLATHQKLTSLFIKPVLAIIMAYVYVYVNQISFNSSITLPEISSLSFLLPKKISLTQKNYRQQHILESVIYTIIEILCRHSKKLLPSSYLHEGSFSNKMFGCVKLKSWDQSQTPAILKKIQLFGKKYGCHTCGTKNRVDILTNNSEINSQIFIGDHQPPRAIVREIIWPYLQSKSKNSSDRTQIRIKEKLEAAKLYPQCNQCSLKQAANVRSVLKDYENICSANDKNKIDEFAKNALKIVKSCRSHGFEHLYFVMPWSFIVNFVYKYYL